jgi:hypothetical protein
VLLGEAAELQFQRVDPPGGGTRAGGLAAAGTGRVLDQFGGAVDQQRRGQVVEGVVEEEGVVLGCPQAGGPGHRGVGAAVGDTLVRRRLQDWHRTTTPLVGPAVHVAWAGSIDQTSFVLRAGVDVTTRR